MATQAEIDAFLRSILGFESGGDATAQNPSASASGLFGYIDSTWDNFGGYTHAREAPASVQWQKARLDVAGKLQRYGGDWRKVAMAWYYPDWVDEPDKWNSIPRQDAGNTKTLNEYADLVMSRFKGKATTTASGGRGGTVATAPKSRQEILDYIADNYPDYYAVMAINAEVKNVLLEAAENEWSGTKLRGELAKTRWWKTTSASARTWDADYAQDKATGEQLLRQTQGELAAQASRLGVTLSTADLRKMALNVRRLGWSPQQIAEALAGRFRQRDAKAGLGMATADSLRALAKDYGVGVSDREITGWTQRLLSGKADEEAWRADLVRRAKMLYGSIAESIDAGTTVADYFDPYARKAAEILGLNPEEVDFRDSRWQRALAVPGEGGKRTPMDFSQWETELKTNPLYGYRLTANGKREEASFASAAARAMGWT